MAYFHSQAFNQVITSAATYFSAAVNAAAFSNLGVQIAQTITSGSPSLVCSLQQSMDGTNWVDVAALPVATAALTTTGTSTLSAGAQIGNMLWGQVRLKMVMGGTPTSVLVTVDFAGR